MKGMALRGLVLIGTYTGEAGPAGISRGLYAADWDGAVGGLGPPRLVAELEHPSFIALHPTRPLAYVASETGRFRGVDSGAVAVVRLDGTHFTLASQHASHGTSPCHLAVDPRGEFLVVSNYGSGTAAVYRLRAGLPTGEATVLRLEGHGPKADRQEGPHAHSAVFDPTGDRFYVQDLGTDRLWGYALDRHHGTVAPLVPPFTTLAPGAGPRHMVFHPHGPWAYVINELDNTVTALAWTRTSGALTPFQTVGTLPAGRTETAPSWPADIHVTADGAFLYGSNRGHDSLVVYRIGATDGRLEPVQDAPSGGGHPRNFALAPDGGWLLCANRDADNVVVFRRDPATGRLTSTSATPAPHPVCVVFVPAK